MTPPPQEGQSAKAELIGEDEQLEVPPNPPFCPRCGKPCKTHNDQNKHPLDMHTCEDAECGASWDMNGEVWFWSRTARAKPVRLGTTRGVKGMGR